MGHEAVKLPALAAQNVGKDLRRGKIRIVRTGKTKSDGSHAIGQVGFVMQSGGRDGGKIEFRPRGQLLGRNLAEGFLHLRQGGLRFDIADDDEDGIVRTIPGVVELPQVGAGGFLKRRSRAESVMFVGRALELGFEQLGVKYGGEQRYRQCTERRQL